MVFDPHVEIEGIAYLASSLLFEPYAIKLVPQPQGEFKFGVDLKNEGKTYTKLTIGNDFGTTSYTVYINLPPLKWIYNFEAGFSRVKTNDKIYVYKYLNNKVVAQYENVIDVKGIKVLEELSMSEASSEAEIKKKLPSFLIYTARESFDSSGKSTVKNADGVFFTYIYGKASLCRGVFVNGVFQGKIYEEHQMIMQRESSVVDAITLASGNWPKDGYTRFISGNCHTMAGVGFGIQYGQGAAL